MPATEQFLGRILSFYLQITVLLAVKNGGLKASTKDNCSKRNARDDHCTRFGGATLKIKGKLLQKILVATLRKLSRG